MLKLKHLLMLVFLAIVFNIQGQNDSLVFKNGNYIIGEIKEMDKGVLIVETDYSDSDFKIEWDGVKEVFSESFFLITLDDGRRINGRLLTSADYQTNIITDSQDTIPSPLMDIVFLDAVKRGFWSQLYANIDLGLDMTKANNMMQLSMRSSIGYMAKRWALNGSFNTLFSRQDSTSDINRQDGGLSYKYYLPRDWYAVVAYEFLSNSEQKLDLRSTGNLGMGKYVIHTNKSYWGFSAGVAFNNERFTDETPEKNSLEGFIGTELNLFDLGDFSLLTRLTAYPSFTEAGRWRSDFNLDTKYDLPLDFYIKLNLTFNYDNQPVAGAPETDYVFHTGFGWEW